MTKRVVAICGKGGVGKTAVTAMLARALIALGSTPLLLVDADPAGGLVSAMGEQPRHTLSELRSRIIAEGKVTDGKEAARQLADRLDYYMLDALLEKSNYSMVAMGRKLEKGCFCPANALLRSALDGLLPRFPVALIDAEAGIEQINRQVTRQVDLHVVVTDGSKRSLNTRDTIRSMLPGVALAEIRNRQTGINKPAHESMPLLGSIPENVEVQTADRKGEPLFCLPESNEAMQAAMGVAQRLLVFPPSYSKQ